MEYNYKLLSKDLSSGKVFNARCMSVVNSLNTPFAIYISYTENSSNDTGNKKKY